MRIALARLLLGRPDVLLLDEPTNHLDLAATEWLEDYVKASRATMLIVSHDRYFLDAVVQRVFELRDGKIETFPAGNYSAYRVAQARRAYGERVVLDNVTLTIERGERVALIGPNGAGKSTLLRLLAGRDRPTRGNASLGIGVRPSYFAQDQAEHLDPGNTAFDEV